MTNNNSPFTFEKIFPYATVILLSIGLILFIDNIPYVNLYRLEVSSFVLLVLCLLLYKKFIPRLLFGHLLLIIFMLIGTIFHQELIVESLGVVIFLSLLINTIKSLNYH